MPSMIFYDEMGEWDWVSAALLKYMTDDAVYTAQRGSAPGWWRPTQVYGSPG